MSHTLVLNASYEPLHYCFGNAIQPVQGKVEVVVTTRDSPVRISIKLPAVLRLLAYVPLSEETNYSPRINIFLRDQNQCQYCGDRFAKANLAGSRDSDRARGPQELEQHCNRLQA